jgi:hypothetical protein
MAELPRQSCGSSLRNWSGAYAVQASGWRALALAALYPLRAIAQLTERRPEEGGR